MKIPPLLNHWELKLLALVLAIVTYYALKTEDTLPEKHDRALFSY